MPSYHYRLEDHVSKTSAGAVELMDIYSIKNS